MDKLKFQLYFHNIYIIVLRYKVKNQIWDILKRKRPFFRMWRKTFTLLMSYCNKLQAHQYLFLT